METGGSDDSFSEEESPKKRRDLLTRRPSYRKILNDLGGGEIAGMFLFACSQRVPLFACFLYLDELEKVYGKISKVVVLVVTFLPLWLQIVMFFYRKKANDTL